MSSTSDLKKDLNLARNGGRPWHFLWCRDGGDGEPALRVRRLPFKPAEVAQARREGRNKLLVRGVVASDGEGSLRFLADKHHDNALFQRHVTKKLGSKIPFLKAASFSDGSDAPAPEEEPEATAERAETLAVDRELASGANGSVHRLTDEEGRGGMVVKFPADHDLAQQAFVEEVAAFERLAELGLDDHPNIVRAMGVHEYDGREGLVLEEIKGGTLADLVDVLQRRNPSRVDRLAGVEGDAPLSHGEYVGLVQQVMRGVLEGIAALEEVGLHHVDLKELNVMMTEDGTPKLVDLGSVTGTGEEYDAAETTKNRTTPETHLDGENVAGRGQDEFAVGAMLFSLFEGDWTNRGDRRGETWADYAAEDYLRDFFEQGRTALDEAEEGTAKVGVGEFGRGGGQTAYVEVLEALLHPDSSRRRSAREILEMDFFADPLLDEDGAREVFTRLRTEEDERETPLIIGSWEQRAEAVATIQDSEARQARLRTDAAKLHKASTKALARLGKGKDGVPEKVARRLQTLSAEVDDLVGLLAEDRVVAQALHHSLADTLVPDDASPDRLALKAFVDDELLGWIDTLDDAVATGRTAVEAARLLLDRAEHEDAVEVTARPEAPPLPGERRTRPGDVEQQAMLLTAADGIEMLTGALPEIRDQAKALAKAAQGLDKRAGRLLKIHLSDAEVDADALQAFEEDLAAVEAGTEALRGELRRVVDHIAWWERLPGWREGGDFEAFAVTVDPKDVERIWKKTGKRVEKLRGTEERLSRLIAQAEAAAATARETATLLSG